jgi:hypothetical protein
MTMSEFDTLRADITGLRTDLQGQVASLRNDLQTQIATVRSDLRGQIAALEVRLIRLEVKIDEKPNAATIYQASLATLTGMFAVVVGTIIVLKTIGFIP